MKKIILVIIFLQSVFLFGQQTGTFYYSVFGEACNKKTAKTQYVISRSSENVYKELISVKYNNTWVKYNSYSLYHFENDSSINVKLFIDNKLTKTTKRIYKKQNDSIFSFIDYENDSIVRVKGFSRSLLPLIYHGKIEDYYRNGNKRFEAIYNNNRLISNLRWKEDGEKDISNVFSFEEVEIEPKYAAGSLAQYIGQEIKYPEEALKRHIEGRVVLQLIIMEDGSVDGVEVLKSVNPLLDAEAIRVVKQTSKKWTPGKINDIPVRVAYNIPISFRL